MVRTLLVRGMLVGVVAGLLSFGFARVFGEPNVDAAIAFEESMHSREHAGSAAPVEPAQPGMSAHDHSGDGEELVSRPVQAGLGLFTGVVVYSAAFGGLFALVFAFAYGRTGSIDPRVLAGLIAALGFVAVVIVPALKYPANPPAVGDPDTIGYRTALFWGMLAVSLAAVAVAVFVRRALEPGQGVWNATLIAGGVFVAIVAVAMALLPAIDEVPEHFPAAVLWQFRVASLGTQAIMWATLGLLFGALTQRTLARAA